jgi:hypothetical protein
LLSQAFLLLMEAPDGHACPFLYMPGKGSAGSEILWRGTRRNIQIVRDMDCVKIIQGEID